MPNKKQGRYELYRSKKNNEYAWRFKKNGRVIFRCSETHKKKSHAVKSIAIAKDSRAAEVIDKTKK